MTDNPRIIVTETESGIDLMFFGPALGNSEALNGVNTTEDFKKAVFRLKSRTGRIRIELPDEDIVRDLTVPTLDA